MTAEERVSRLHKRMEEMRLARERQKRNILGAVNVGLILCLLLLIWGGAGGIHSGGAPGLYSGSTMLFEDAGGYVLVAVFAFMIGVVVTVVLRNHQRSAREDEITKRKDTEREEEE